MISAQASGGGEWIDTHCHLDAAEFDADRAAVVARAVAGGVRTLVVPAVAAANFAAVRACADAFPGVRPAYGIHPLYVEHAAEADLDTLRERLVSEAGASAAPVAVGEIGLDEYVPGVDRERQMAFFVAQLRIARALGLPVLLHVRRAHDAVLAAVRRVAAEKGAARPWAGGIAHAFNGSRQQAEAYIALGFRLGFGGVVTNPRARRIRALAAELPLSAIVLETDAPDMAPVFAHGARNEPAYLPRIAATVAELRSLRTEELAQATAANARAALPGLAAAPSYSVS
ncbi:TatD family hydrolase [Rhodocyclus gracilis]|uniref:TatD family hydrolase n=1 Tax=Rhodocyclus gracilis TaxID=2929842 RepID=UPI0030F3B8AD